MSTRTTLRPYSPYFRIPPHSPTPKEQIVFLCILSGQGHLHASGGIHLDESMMRSGKQFRRHQHQGSDQPARLRVGHSLTPLPAVKTAIEASTAPADWGSSFPTFRAAGRSTQSMNNKTQTALRNSLLDMNVLRDSPASRCCSGW